jgi:penicillin-binding protein 1C
MDFIYPKAHSKVYLTKDFDSKIQPVIIKVAHTNRETRLFWYVDSEYKGTTRTFHDLPIEAKTGTHRITVIDESGNEISRKMEIVRE